MNLKEITQKILKGEISSLFKNDGHRLQPVEVAQVIGSLPADSALKAFTTFSKENQLQIFSYLDVFMQKKFVVSMPKENAADILNNISSDDRIAFYASLRHTELGSFYEYLNEKKQEVYFRYFRVSPAKCCAADQYGFCYPQERHDNKRSNRLFAFAPARYGNSRCNLCSR